MDKDSNSKCSNNTKMIKRTYDQIDDSINHQIKLWNRLEKSKKNKKSSKTANKNGKKNKFKIKNKTNQKSIKNKIDLIDETDKNSINKVDETDKKLNNKVDETNQNLIENNQINKIDHNLIKHIDEINQNSIKNIVKTNQSIDHKRQNRINQNKNQFKLKERSKSDELLEDEFYKNYDNKLNLYLNLKKLPFKRREQMYKILNIQLNEHPIFKTTNLINLNGYTKELKLPDELTLPDDNLNNKRIKKF